MKIAQIAPLMESVPPRLYGGTERIVSYLADELVRLGHDVTLFASGDSVSRANLVSCATVALRLDANVRDVVPYYMLMLDRVRRYADEFDVLHFHIDQFHFPLFCQMANRTVTTLHGRQDLPDLKALYVGFSDMPLVSISNSQRKPIANANFAGTVYHGLPAQTLKPNYKPSGDYVAFLGRISPEKRPDRAIRIAQALGLRIKIAAKIDKVDEAYFREHIASLFNLPGVEYIGEIDERSKSEFLGEASALLFPIDWPEPFGLSMIEAMACGTPVLAFRCGSVPEIIDPGVTGLIVDSMDEAIRVMPQVLALDRRAVRQKFEQRFSASRMAKDYVQVYRSLIKQQALPERDAPVSRRQLELEQGMN
jgi:glycosyltransferase involved in cell wall biosynthesis